MAYSESVVRHEIRSIGPAGSSQGHVWERLWLQIGAKPAQKERERCEREAAKIVARQEREHERRARLMAEGFASIASAVKAARKAERATQQAAHDRDAATWARFRNAPAYKDAFTPKGKVRAGWALVSGVPCYLPAALAALANGRGVLEASAA